MIGLDFAVLPPEVNSGRMYAGGGSGPLMAAAGAWDRVAAELNAAAGAYRRVVSEVADSCWWGASSMSMSAAAAVYAVWMGVTAARAEQTADRARSAAAAYEAAFAATVPPSEVAANRALLVALVAGNVVGQNTGAIAATEAQYGEMWAQDAAAMYGYAGASAAAATLVAFTEAPCNTNPSGMVAQHVAARHAVATSTAGNTQSVLSHVPNTLHSLAAGSPPGGVPQITDTFESLTSDISGFLTLIPATNFSVTGTLFTLFPMVATSEGPLVAALSAAKSGEPGAGLGTLASSSGAAARGLGSGFGEAGISSGLGQAASVGGLSVPPAWGSAPPGIRLVSAGLPMTSLDVVPAAGPAAPGGFFGGMPPVASMVNAPRSRDALPRRLCSKALPSWAAEPDDSQRARTRPLPPHHRAFGAPTTAISGREELDQLRKKLTDLTKKRDLLKRAAVFMIKQAQK
ncbi:PPE family protein [Mycobacterium sp. Aquia_216]|uniref:PPE family protein n=1 Tax=Mycobacterium sp. Aquia_216 TaxID=2991729 RepID=UPI00227AA96B|nr:PPE family protein [Mycobacterium sp. Aquia_216]WAJ45150.1 PPE family protein [Mycobacterium sp. Aquia_216]